MEPNLQAARDLERLVAERTAELSQANARLQQEIREHQQAQRQINFQANILAQINDAVIAIDNQHCITYWNRAAEKLYGCTAAEILGQRLEASHRYLWLQPEDEQAAADALATTGVANGYMSNLASAS
jgi:PAS domain-containing protein